MRSGANVTSADSTSKAVRALHCKAEGADIICISVGGLWKRQCCCCCSISTYQKQLLLL
jgi:hypothetical protein